MTSVKIQAGEIYGIVCILGLHPEDKKCAGTPAMQ